MQRGLERSRGRGRGRCLGRDDDRKIGMLIAAFDDERTHLQGAIGALNQTGAQLQRDVTVAAKGAVEETIEKPCIR